MTTRILFLFIVYVLHVQSVKATDPINGAWKNDQGVIIFTDNFFSYSEFTPTAFVQSYGGSWEQRGNDLILSYEFHTSSPEKVGLSDTYELTNQGGVLKIGKMEFAVLDQGEPGKLYGAWLFYNRIRNGQPGTPRTSDNPRKTMKILSGTRFQWIAYNTETKEFSGTGGGTYTTNDGKYTENIDFFSRDNNRVGASLEFDFEIKDDGWHHKGLSSRGDPIYEIWKRRSNK